MTIKDNGDGTFTLIPTTWFQNDVWTVCRGCGQRVTGDSIHTCSPQTKEWQYLTDAEIKEIIGGYGNEGGIGAYTREMFDKIEAKIKEKNTPQQWYMVNKDGYVKPLSDEEIWDWFEKNTVLAKESALMIARAIEERHGIK